MKQILLERYRANAPLVEAGILLMDGVSLDQVLDQLNELGDDFDASPHWTNALSGKENALTLDATPEALRRLFGWEIKRVNLERWNPETGEWGLWEDTYRWEQVNRPTRWPPCLEGKVLDIGLSQPGRLDSGQPYRTET
jgi:hypothetical protein